MGGRESLEKQRLKNNIPSCNCWRINFLSAFVLTACNNLIGLLLERWLLIIHWHSTEVLRGRAGSGGWTSGGGGGEWRGSDERICDPPKYCILGSAIKSSCTLRRLSMIPLKRRLDSDVVQAASQHGMLRDVESGLLFIEEVKGVDLRRVKLISFTHCFPTTYRKMSKYHWGSCVN